LPAPCSPNGRPNLPSSRPGTTSGNTTTA
jgi:hypothetical protein